jgi:hypothetical protein
MSVDVMKSGFPFFFVIINSFIHDETGDDKILRYRTDCNNRPSHVISFGVSRRTNEHRHLRRRGRHEVVTPRPHHRHIQERL